MVIEYKTLKNTKKETVYKVFCDAFSNYQVKIDMTFEKFSNMMKRRSVDFSISLGSFYNKKLIGFILNGKRLFENQLIAYDSGTGISQKYQGLKLGKNLLQENLKLLSKNGVSKYVLEVITNNKKAINL